MAETGLGIAKLHKAPTRLKNKMTGEEFSDAPVRINGIILTCSRLEYNLTCCKGIKCEQHI